MEPPKKIERSRDDRVIAGVCGGIGRAVGLDPTLVRILAVVLVAFGGIGLLAYAAAALLLGEEGGGAPMLDLGLSDGDRTAALAGLALLGVAVVVLAGVGPVSIDNPWVVLSAPAVALVAWLALRERPLPDPATIEVVPSGATRHTIAAVPAPEPARRSASGPITWGALLVVLALGAATLQLAVDEPPWDLFAAGAVVAAGFALLVSAPFGGAPGLIVGGFLLATAVGLVATSDVSFRGGAGERSYAPASLAQLREEYRLGAGRMELDLGGLAVPDGAAARVRVELGAGEALVTVPADADVVVHGQAFMGEIEAFGQSDGGVDVDTTREDVGRGGARIELDADVGFGAVRVAREGDGG